MIPDLGKYASAVLSSYAVSIVLIVALVVVSVMRARRIKRELAAIEERQKRHG
ncbi:heme exporter protein CcmD [Thalassococcus sp. CAU 1522]|uniref:Heme exporter protein D n=1 Tax=Thalassococcus arenae TaxID=2851652 RepID=A0ABS6NB78_9RHOB|nr:heme exporter protein CcmD [Thalassococcus arenae]MBV2361264.1 heme exporter protein CcmD [Thalassococcus arenae]